MTRRLLPALWVLALYSPASALEQLSLSTALKVAQIQNFTLAMARNNFESNRLQFQNTFEQMWFPQVSLQGSTSTAYTLGQIPRSSATDPDFPSDKAKGDTSAFVGVSMGSYTLFNSFKDKLAYDVAKMSYERSKQNFKETVRSVKSQVVTAYFLAKTEQDKLDVAQRSLEMARALLRLVKSRSHVGRATASDVSSAEMDVLTAQNSVNQFVGSEQSARWNLNTLLRYPLDKQHALSSELKYVPLTLTAESALGMYEAAGPGILNAALALKSSETSLKLAQMNRLPLPTISFSGIGAQYARYPGGPWEFSNTTTGSASGNFDINGGVMLTLPLVGPGGLFNQRTVSQAYLAKENSRLSYAEAKLSGQSSIISTILSIQQQEKYVANQQETLEKATKLLASLAEDMATSRISRLEMRDALREARNTELDLKNQIQSHLSAKLGLGQTLGSDQFIPEN